LVGLAPLLARLHWYKPGIPFRRLELFGTGEPLEHEIASDYVGLLAEKGYESEVAREVTELLVTGALGPWDELVCTRMCAKASATRAWLREMREQGLSIETLHEADAHYIPLPASWDDYLASLSSSRRYRMRRTLRDYEKWTGVEPTLSRVTSKSGLRRGLDILASLHEERWSGDGLPGAFSSAQFREFHERVMPALFERDALDLMWIEGRDGPAAALYNIVWDGRVHFYQSGRRTDLPSRLRPGIVMHALAVQRAIRAGCKEYDFLAGGARYKQELSLSARKLISVRLSRLTLREGTRHILQRGARALKRRLPTRR
jgi:CelD/BcsL family acetyltransferase involved in cellulose biosynthesis